MKFFTFLALLAFCGFASVSGQDAAQIAQLRNAVASFQEVVTQINVQFEMAQISKNVSELDAIVESVKSYKAVMNQEEVVINSAISSADYFSFSKRVQLETIRINILQLSKALDTIALEVLGFKAGVSDFPRYFVSEPLGMTLSVLERQSVDLALSMQKVEGAIETAMKDQPVEQKNKAAVMSSLSDVSGKAAHLQSQLYSTYILVVEQANIDGRELDIVQKMHVDFFINSLQYFIHFTKEFGELFDRLVIAKKDF